MTNLRIGHGYDVHRLVKNRKLILGGVEIEHTQGLLGHSDADVVVHAIMDALLGAVALPDIGCLFPDKDEEYKDADSLVLLGEVIVKLNALQAFIVNIDCTIIAQTPKLSGYIPDMISNIAQVCQLTKGQVNIKATTEEHLGFTGEEQGIAAHCVCLVELA